MKVIYLNCLTTSSTGLRRDANSGPASGARMACLTTARTTTTTTLLTRKDLPAFRACLVRDRVDPGGVNLLLISGRQAAFGPLLWGSFLACRSVSTIESFQIGPPRTLEPTERFDPHPYQTGSERRRSKDGPRYGPRALPGRCGRHRLLRSGLRP